LWQAASFRGSQRAGNNPLHAKTGRVTSLTTQRTSTLPHRLARFRTLSKAVISNALLAHATRSTPLPTAMRTRSRLRNSTPSTSTIKRKRQLLKQALCTASEPPKQTRSFRLSLAPVVNLKLVSLVRREQPRHMPQPLSQRRGREQWVLALAQIVIIEIHR